MKRILSFVLASVLMLGLASCGNSSAPGNNANNGNGSGASSTGEGYDKLNLKISYATGDTGMDGIVAIKFEELVEERSGGAIQIERFPNCQLVGGNMERHVEMMVAGGAFELAIISTSSFNTVDNRFYIAGTPFLFPTYDAMWECMDSTGGEFMNDVYADYNIKRLDTFPNGLQHIANDKREITCVADMKDLKMRAYGDTQMKLQRALGADPVNMRWSELYSALQTGTVDGNTNGYQTMYSGSFTEVQHYITECGIIASTYDIMANMGNWNSWSAATQELLQECATEAAHYGRDYMVEEEAKCKQAFLDAGCTITVLNEEQLQEFKDAAVDVINECKELAGPEACVAYGLD